MAVINSPLRYPGGKSSLSVFLANLLAANELTGGTYVEPYAGGAGAAINLLFGGQASHIVINDADPLIYNFWNAILNHTDEFLHCVRETPLTIKEWHHYKAISQAPAEHSTFDVGFATFFLNRCNRSGILKAGPIGGKTQAGEWTLDARFNRDNLCQRIAKIAERRDDITLHNMDALAFLAGPVAALDTPTLVYLDPPYYQKGQQLYLNHYAHQDHVDLANFITQDQPFHWIMSYDNAPEIRELYAQTHHLAQFDLNYFAHSAKKGSEIIICRPDLRLPEGDIEAKYGLAG